MNKRNWSVEIVAINGPDDLRETTRGSDEEIVQPKPGKLLGSITNFGIGNLLITLGRFNSEVQMRGTLHPDKVVLGTILDRSGISTQWWKDVQVGDVGIFPAHVEFDAIHTSIHAIELGNQPDLVPYILRTGQAGDRGKEGNQ